MTTTIVFQAPPCDPPRFTLTRVPSAADMAELHVMGEAARCIEEDDYGSDRHIDAENLFFEAIGEMFGGGTEEFNDAVSCYITGCKMGGESIDWAMDAARECWANAMGGRF